MVEVQVSRNAATDETSSVYSYHLVLFTDTNEMFDLWLPKEPEGAFRFSDKPEHRLISVVGKDGQWVACCRKPAYTRGFVKQLF